MKTLPPLKHLIQSLLSLSLASCGSLAEWKKSISEGPSPLPWFDSSPSSTVNRPEQRAQMAVSPQQAAWNSRALQVQPTALYAAKDRWPWATGNQLRRRAQILQMGANYEAIQRLDSQYDSHTELQILRQMMEKSQ